MARREIPQTVACGIIHQTREGAREVLIGKVEGPPYEGKWTFPGGPVEPGETPEAGFRRALESQLGMKVEILYGQPPFDQPWDGVMTRWRYFFCEGREKDVNNQYFREVRWVPEPSLREYEFDPVAQQVVDWVLESRETGL